MPVQAILLIQNIQLVCYTIVFGALALQRWSDLTKRWLWYSFLANAAGALIELFDTYLPTWISHGLDWETIPLSYAILNIAVMHFDRRSRRSAWISLSILLAGLPFFLAWRNDASIVRGDALGDLLIALECIVTVVLLLGRREKATWTPRVLMSAFLIFFIAVELARVVFVFGYDGDPDAGTLGVASAVAYIVNVALLPLAFVWMMQARLEVELMQQSIVDPLTGVLNRRGLEQALHRELSRCSRYGGELTLAMLDLDHFKQINDRFGHAGGDAILTNVATYLAGQLRQTDVVGRFGGEEFVLLLPHSDVHQVGPVLERLCHSLRQHNGLISPANVHVTASLGVTSTSRRRPMVASDLLAEADSALYRAKANGRNQVCFFQPGDVVSSSPRPLAMDKGYAS